MARRPPFPCASGAPMPPGPARRLLLAALLLSVLWALFGPSGLGEELLSLSLASLLPAPASPGPPPALPRLLIANARACAGPGAPPFLLVLVSSAPAHLERRAAIRASWGGLRRARGLGVRTLFVLGQPGARADLGLGLALAREAAARGDIVQAAFQDSYRNLTLKTLSGLGWVDRHCRGARFVLKTDDDVYVNVPELVSELLLRGGARGPGEPGRGPLLYLGRVHWRVQPSRAAGGRHQVSEELWPRAWGPFPPYASGTGYVLSAEAVQLVLRMAGRTPLLPVEDVFVGVSAHKGGLAPTHSVKLAGATRYPLDRCCYGKFLLTSHGMDPRKMQEVWKLVAGQDGHRTAPLCSWLQSFLGILRCRFLAWLHS